MAAQPVSDMPSASAMLFMESAVPMGLQWPTLGALDATSSMNWSMSMRPAASSWRAYQMIVPEPASPPAKWPSSMGPPDSTIAGMSTVAAPMIMAGGGLWPPGGRPPPPQKKALQRFAPPQAA